VVKIILSEMLAPPRVAIRDEAYRREHPRC
jgi:hypothetical protein